MPQPTNSNFTVLDFLQWNGLRQLQITPKFQRRSVWSEKAKSYLIDTIIKEKPVPPIFVRLKLDTANRKTVREVVDGQQRIRSVLEFVENQFPILKLHNEDLSGFYFDDLNKELKDRVLQYVFSVFTLQNVSDADVLDIFARFNTYAVALNAQELRNANFTGLFKRCAYTLAHKFNKFWLVNRLFADRQIARMLEVELVSELLVTMLAGIISTSKRELDSYYDEFDDAFPQRDRLMRRFDFVIDTLGELYDGQTNKSIFRRKPLLFSLFIAIYSCRYGLPGQDGPRIKFTAGETELVKERLKRFDQTMRGAVPARYVDFDEAMNRATANQGNRQIRHDILVELIESALA